MSESPTPSGHPVELASKGRYYKSGGSRVLLSHIRGEYEAMLADANAQTFPSIMDQILRDLTSELPVESFDQLLIGDKYHLMFHLRMISYPQAENRYEFSLTCPQCKSPNSMMVDLAKDVEYKKPPEDAKEPFEVHLPMCDRMAKVRLMRVFDEVEMIKFVRKHRQKKDLKGDPAYHFAIAQGLLSLDDEEMDFEKSLAWVKNAAGADTLALRDTIDEHDVGPELEMEFSCSHCQNWFYTRIPLDADFFRPGASRRRRN